MTPLRLRVGSYAEGGGDGVYALAYSRGAGFAVGGAFQAQNASFGAASCRHGLHYLVDEQAMGRFGVYRRESEGWTQLAQLTTEGREPCYIALDPEERRVAIANYGSGSIALYALTPEGLPHGEITLWAQHGGGPDPERQEGPHVHCVRFSPDGRALYAVDLGTDQILRFALDEPLLERAQIAWQAPPGSGPRHLLFHPTRPLAVLVSELASMLTLFDVTTAGLVHRTSRSTLPDGCTGDNLGGHLTLNRAGDRIYVTNRGHDSIGVFALDAASGRLECLQHISSGGASPRHLLLLEADGLAVCVNEQDGTVVAFELAPDGALTDTGHRATIAGAAFVFEEVAQEPTPLLRQPIDRQTEPPRDGKPDFLAGHQPDGIPMTGEEDPLCEVDDPGFAESVAAFAASERRDP